MARHRYVVADVFTDAREIPESSLQALAREVNFSETVFVYPPEGEGHVRVRIFTPSTELPFAGHPVLGTAFVLAGPLQLVEIALETGRGIVRIALEREGPRISFGRMQQPVPTIEPFAKADELLAALGGVESRLPVELYDNGVPHVYVALGSKAEVAALQPDFAAIAPLGDVGINCFAGEGASWKTRMFGIGLGMVEDPATGSAAGPLALHLARHGVVDYGTELEIVQGEEIKRRSVLYATAHSPERIEVGGTAVIVARGEFQL